MLVLTRRVGQQIIIDDHIRIEVLQIRDGKVRIGVDAPPSVRVDRLEIYQKRIDDARMGRVDHVTSNGHRE